MEELLNNTNKLCQVGKGILAADESTNTIGKRFAQINVENNLENRTSYRKLLFTTEDLNKYISGVITYEETLSTMDNNAPLVKHLQDQNILIGIKTDLGLKPLYGTNDEKVAQGLDNLDERCKKYYQMGARFAKWRCVLKIDEGCPSNLSISSNAEVLARYAAISQANGLVPIVEPEILMDGSHSIEETLDVTVNVIKTVYKRLVDHNVKLEATLLKPNMVRKGVDNDQVVTSQEIARLTLMALQRSVPVSVAGVVFLSGGMTEEEATCVLNDINIMKQYAPWTLSFSYGRALQHSVLQEWRGKEENIKKAQLKLLERAKANSLATLGKYTHQSNIDITDESLHVKDYSY